MQLTDKRTETETVAVAGAGADTDTDANTSAAFVSEICLLRPCVNSSAIPNSTNSNLYAIELALLSLSD